MKIGPGFDLLHHNYDHIYLNVYMDTNRMTMNKHDWNLLTICQCLCLSDGLTVTYTQVNKQNMIYQFDEVFYFIIISLDTRQTKCDLQPRNFTAVSRL